MLDCRFREPVALNGSVKETPFWARILPHQKMRGYYRCFGLTAENEEDARKIAYEDTTHNPYFHLNVSEIEIVEVEEVSRDDAMFKRLSTTPDNQPDTLANGHLTDPIWFRDGGGYYW